MRWLLFSFFCLLITSSLLQAQDLHFHSYKDKYNFVQQLRYNMFANKPQRQIMDTLQALKVRAMETGDSELTDEIKLFIYQTSYNLHEFGDTTESRIKNIIAYAHEHQLLYLEADALQSLGVYYDVLKQRNAAIDQFVAAYNIYKNFPGEEFAPKQMYLSVMGGKFSGLEDYRNAIKYQLLALHTPNTTPIDIFCAIYNDIGMSYRNTKKYDSAIYYFKQGYDHSVKTGNTPYKGITIGNIGICYYLMSRYDEAIPLLRQDITTSLATSQMKNAVNSMTILASIYNYKHRNDSSLILLDTALNIFHRKFFWTERKVAEQLFKQLYTAYATRGDYKRALSFADTTLMIKDSIAAENNSLTLARAREQIEYAQHKLEAEKLQNQINISRLEIARNRIVVVSSIAGVTVLLIVLIFIVRLNNQVTRQKKELENLNDVKNKIFGIISHDLRTPVNSLVSFTQLLEHGSVPPEKLHKYAGVLKDNLGYTSELMENLLNWARSQMQGYKPVFERFDIAETVHQAIGLLNNEAEKKRLMLIDNIPSGAIVLADVNMASLIIRNLLSNAIKYTPLNGTITLSATRKNGQLLISVTDTGVGIPADPVARFNGGSVAQPIYSTPGTNKEKGTGLGLMLCKNFANLMHGSITVQSELQKGSAFTLTLPTD